MRIVLLSIFLFILLSGCATPRRVEGIRVQDLQNRVRYLEAELEKRDEEISILEEELERLRQAHKRVERAPIIRPTMKRIQMALRNAGFYKGPIDGKMGPQTRKAIKEFQKQNGLTPDGVVGRKTWEKLKNYL